MYASAAVPEDCYAAHRLPAYGYQVLESNRIKLIYSDIFYRLKFNIK